MIIFVKIVINSKRHPIRQNEIHVGVLEDFLRDNKIIKNYPIESLVVISHDRTIIDKKYATKNVGINKKRNINSIPIRLAIETQE